MSLLKKLGLYYRTAKHLRPIQIATRIQKEFRQKANLRSKTFTTSPNSNKFTNINEELLDSANLVAKKDITDCSRNANSILEGSFSFLQEEVSFSNLDNIKWKLPSKSRLWLFNLNYFDYAFDLGITYFSTKKTKYFRAFETLVKSWMNNHKKVEGDPWHPYPTSLRIVNWIFSYLLFQEEIEKREEFRNILLNSLEFQLSYLESNLEYDLQGNHLFANAKALFIGGKFFEKNRWSKKGKNILMSQLKEQILTDGGHFERSPMYHCQILNDLLDCFLVASETKDFSRLLEEKAEQMLSFLGKIEIPTGEVPLFNDTSLANVPSFNRISSYAKEIGVEGKSNDKDNYPIRLEDSGYYFINSEESWVIIDGGKIGPDYQPGHGHCDIFSYEFGMGDEKIITDSGNYEYLEGKIRNYCRSTKAHNTISVDGMEQSEIWKSFRVGERAEPSDIELKDMGKYVRFTGQHNGFAKQGKNVFHIRSIFFVKNLFWIVLDRLTGKENHAANSFIHLHPNTDLINEEGAFLANKNDYTLGILPFGQDSMKVENGFYCPSFGEKYENDVIKLSKHDDLPMVLGYLLTPSGQFELEKAKIRQEDGIELTVNNENKQIGIFIKDGELSVENF